MDESESYFKKYRHIKMRRRAGILEMTLHSDGGPLQWGHHPKIELWHAFDDIASDRGNRIVILTGTGNEFMGPRDTGGIGTYTSIQQEVTPVVVDTAHWYMRRMMMRLMDIEVPMIGVVNGPALRHSELPLMCDIVIAADDATFEDTAHFLIGSMVPGDGVTTVYSLLLGLNRARYMTLTGQVLSAKEAKDLGLVGEVMPREKLLPRAWELAEALAKKPDLALRYTRMVLTRPLKKALEEDLPYFMSLETMAGMEKSGATEKVRQ